MTIEEEKKILDRLRAAAPDEIEYFNETIERLRHADKHPEHSNTSRSRGTKKNILESPRIEHQVKICSDEYHAMECNFRPLTHNHYLTGENYLCGKQCTNFSKCGNTFGKNYLSCKHIDNTVYICNRYEYNLKIQGCRTVYCFKCYNEKLVGKANKRRRRLGNISKR